MNECERKEKQISKKWQKIVQVNKNKKETRIGNQDNNNNNSKIQLKNVALTRT